MFEQPFIEFALNENCEHVNEGEEKEQDGKEDEAVDVELRDHPVLPHHLRDHRRRRNRVRVIAGRGRGCRRVHSRLPEPFLILVVAEDLQVEKDQRVLEQGAEDEKYASQNPSLVEKERN